MKSGKLYGVSVGPGDPELMTLKALKAIRDCSVIATPRTRGSMTLALDIARKNIDMDTYELLFLDIDMHAPREEQDRTYRDFAQQIMRKLDDGSNVAMLNLGDASLYSTWSYVEQVVTSEGYECETVPGVTSFCASAAKLNTSLTQPDAPLRIIPASYHELDEELRLPGTKVLMKLGRQLPKLVETLEEQGLSEHASMVVNCGLDDERVLDHVEALGDEGYFVTILVDDADYAGSTPSA